MEWYKELDFDYNPFELDPFKAEAELFGMDKEKKEVIYRISSGAMALIEGKKGSGKTALLKYAVDNFKGRGRVIYVDGRRLNKRLDINKLLNKKPKGMILLLDNVTSFTKKTNEKIKFAYDEGRISSVIFSAPDKKKVEFVDSIWERIGKNIIVLKKLPIEDALEAAKYRLDNDEILPDEIIREIYKKSEDMKHFFVNCYLICDHVIKEDRDVATKEDLEQITTQRLKEEIENHTDICKNCKGKLEKTKMGWRCPSCDFYCKHCGAFLDEYDIVCPVCSKEVPEDEI